MFYRLVLGRTASANYRAYFLLVGLLTASQHEHICRNMSPDPSELMVKFLTKYPMLQAELLIMAFSCLKDTPSLIISIRKMIAVLTRQQA